MWYALRMVVLYWNGVEVPAELASLPPGRYVLEPVATVAELSDDEETGLLDALASHERGEGMDEDEMDTRVAAVLGP